KRRKPACEEMDRVARPPPDLIVTVFPQKALRKGRFPTTSPLRAGRAFHKEDIPRAHMQDSKRVVDQNAKPEKGRNPMSIRLAISPARAGGVAFAAAFALLACTSAKADPGPFSGFAGSWSGTGTIKVANGSNERIRCRVNYSVKNSGNALSQTLRCASDS